MNYCGNVDGVYGVKTGFTGNAGRCLVSSCNRNNLDIIVVVLGSGTKNQRTQDSINLINYIYNTYELYDFSKIINDSFSNFINNTKLTINKSYTTPEIYLSNVSNTFLPIKKNDINNINTSIYSLSVLNSPINKDTKIGILQVKVGSIPILDYDIRIKNEIERKSWKDYFIDILKHINNKK